MSGIRTYYEICLEDGNPIVYDGRNMHIPLPESYQVALKIYEALGEYLQRGEEAIDTLQREAIESYIEEHEQSNDQYNGGL
jgi:hypothetical protein